MEKSIKPTQKILLLLQKGGCRRGKCTAECFTQSSASKLDWLFKEDQKCPCPMVLQLDPQLVELRPCSCSEGVAASSIVPSLPGSGELLRGSFTPCSPSHSIGSGLGDAISILPWWWKMLVHRKILKLTVKGSNSVRQWKPASRYCQEPGEVFWEGNWSWPKRSLDY